jgi:hypothetical protein
MTKDPAQRSRTDIGRFRNRSFKDEDMLGSALAGSPSRRSGEGALRLERQSEALPRQEGVGREPEAVSESPGIRVAS